MNKNDSTNVYISEGCVGYGNQHGDAANKLYRVRVGGLAENAKSAEWGTLRETKSPLLLICNFKLFKT